MGYILKSIKLFFRITAVICLIILALTACGREDFEFPVESTDIPSTLPPTVTLVPTTVIISTPAENHPFPTLQTDNETERIHFDPDETANINGTLEAGKSYEYIFKAEEGQVLTVNIAASHIGMRFTILDVFNQEWGATNGSETIMTTVPSSGDYYVTATAPKNNGRYGYSINLSITSRQSASSADSPSPPTTEPTIALPSSTMMPTVTGVLPATLPSPPANTPVVPQPERLEFDAVNTPITINNQFDGSTLKKYIFHANKGQTIIVFANISQPGFEISVIGQDGILLDSVRSGHSIEDVVPTTQDYLLNLAPIADAANQSYTFTISVASQPTSIPVDSGTGLGAGIERILINPESASTDVNGTLFPNSINSYVLFANDGETMTINVTPNNSNIAIFMRGSDGTQFEWTLADTQFSAVIPQSQDYLIDLASSDKSNEINYILTITIR